MHSLVQQLALLWHVILLAVLVGYAVRSQCITVRTLALESLALVTVPALALLAMGRREAGYLDIALVLALLGFAQTVATARLTQKRRELK